jgi:hypothetical protein
MLAPTDCIDEPTFVNPDADVASPVVAFDADAIAAKYWLTRAVSLTATVFSTVTAFA